MKKQMNYVEKMQVALDALTEVFEDVNDLKNQLKRIEECRQDVLHMMENANFNASQGFALAKRMQDLCRERRDIKNRIEQANETKKVTNSFKDNIKRNLEHAIKQVGKLQNDQDKRVYNLRRLKEYEEWNNKVTEQKLA